MPLSKKWMETYFEDTSKKVDPVAGLLVHVWNDLLSRDGPSSSPG